MAVESATYVSDLNTANPAAGDNRSEGDDHIRLVKSVLKTTLPNVSGAMNASHTELNYVVGVTSALQTQLNAKAPSASPTLTGTATAVGLTVSGTLTASGTAIGVTQAAGTNGTSLATTEFVQTAVANATGGASRAEMYFYGSF